MKSKEIGSLHFNEDNAHVYWIIFIHQLIMTNN